MALIETVDLWKTYVMGTEEIHALRGVSTVSYTHLTLPTNREV